MFNGLLINIQENNAREKLVNILDFILSDNNIQSMNNVLTSQVKNPQFVVTGIKDCIIKDAPKIAKIILQGKADGSITTDYPSECAEVFMILLNVWINPILFERNLSETVNRLKFLQQMMKQLGVDIVSDLLIQKTVDLYSDMEGCK
ncbi:MAG: hypothetical protein ACREV6_16075 [Clostridium sp.]|uniref:hypothetical protein n=1 Tax=Clostridium sp. TaxID=1506 RepID=UPI003D6C9076